MRTVAIAVLLVSAATSPGAITWEFEEGTQGWQIRLGGSSGSFFPPLDASVEEGVLRIPVTEQFLEQVDFMGEAYLDDRYPVLISPQLDLDSGLFDRVEIRLRFVHPDPVATWVYLTWINDIDASEFEVSNIELLGLGAPTVIISEWQEVVFHPLDDKEQWDAYRTWGDEIRGEATWDGILEEIRLSMDLFESSVERPGPVDLSELPEWVEIDRIVLTGAEERLQGELPPPEVSATHAPGLLFGPARFVPMGQEGLGYASTAVPGAGIADLDGDGDLDVLVSWGLSSPDRCGFVAALNDGTGELSETRRPVPGVSVEGQPFYSLAGLADANGDGLVDLFYRHVGLGVWLTDAESPGRYVHQAIPGMGPDDEDGDGVHDGYPLYLDDFDGDGDVDLLVSVFRWTTTGDSFLRMLVNDGQGGYSLGDFWELPQHWAGAVRDFDGDGKLDMRWFPIDSLYNPRARIVMQLSYNILEAGTEQTFEMVVEDASGLDYPAPFAYGDFSGDGAFDMILPGRSVEEWGRDRHSMLIAVNDGTDRYFELKPWQGEEVVYQHFPNSLDLNGDGLLDVVVANRHQRTGRNVIVYLGREDGFPIEEGRYGLAGFGNAVWPGDLDADADPDLVVIDGQYRGGGLHVLYTTASTRPPRWRRSQRRFLKPMRWGKPTPTPSTRMW